jgi:hypothetical protein
VEIHSDPNYFSGRILCFDASSEPTTMIYALLMVLTILGGVTAPPSGAASQRVGAKDMRLTCTDFLELHSAQYAQARPELSGWDSCLSRAGRPATMLRLCERYGDHIDGLTWNFIKEILRAGVSDQRALCVMDTAVVRSQYHCTYPENFGGTALLAELARLLGLNWEKQGVLDRADELFRYADAVIEKSDQHLDGRQAILRDWALLEVARGNTDHAKALAKLQTALQRQAYEHGKGDTSSLIGALKFEAKVLADLGLPKEAQSANDEAETLRSKQN